MHAQTVADLIGEPGLGRNLPGRRKARLAQVLDIILAPKAESSQNREWCQPGLDLKAHRGLSGKRYVNDPARMYTAASALPKRNSGGGAV